MINYVSKDDFTIFQFFNLLANFCHQGGSSGKGSSEDNQACGEYQGNAKVSLWVILSNDHNMNNFS